MSVYVIADVEVIDHVAYEEYRRGVLATVTAYGGRFLVRAGATEVLEGDWSPKRCVILEFPDMDRFHAWWSSPEYLPLRAIRAKAARSNVIVTQGLQGA